MVPGNVCGLAGPGLPELNLSLLATSLQPPSKGTTMKNDKHGKRGNKEAKKPKKEKVVAAAASPLTSAKKK